MSPRKKSLPESTSSVPAAASAQHEEIAVLAYEVFLKRGCVHGLDLDDWLQAERELLAKDFTPSPEPPKPVRRRKVAGGASA